MATLDINPRLYEAIKSEAVKQNLSVPEVANQIVEKGLQNRGVDICVTEPEVTEVEQFRIQTDILIRKMLKLSMKHFVVGLDDKELKEFEEWLPRAYSLLTNRLIVFSYGLAGPETPTAERLLEDIMTSL